jgi:hypothetical protein
VKSLSLIASLLLASCVISATSQTRPNLSGIWKANLSKSKLASEGLLNLVEQFDQQGATLTESLTTVTARGTSTVKYTYAIDGKETVNTVDGEKVTSTARWNGETLVLAWRDEGGVFERQLSFSDHGNALTVAAHDSSADGETNDTIVLEKQKQ